MISLRNVCRQEICLFLEMINYTSFVTRDAVKNFIRSSDVPKTPRPGGNKIGRWRTTRLCALEIEWEECVGKTEITLVDS